MSIELAQAPLGRRVAYIQHYSPELLYPIARELNRKEIGIATPLPFKGADIWNAYELSWLNPKGKPQVALGEIIVPCESPRLIESKSLKLYLNSFNQTFFTSQQEVAATIQRDLTAVAQAPVEIKLFSIAEVAKIQTAEFAGTCLDDLDVTCSNYDISPDLLTVEQNFAEETVYSNLLKSNCLVTAQPDWGSIQIAYAGKRIKPESLLQYLVSYRNHVGFGEQCIERIYMDILMHCKPEKLTVYGRYTRRGGLDINPYRSTDEHILDNIRSCRQ